MVSIKESNAIAEVIYYLKGIKQQDVNKIPKKLMQYLKENASKDYECHFDYNKPLEELDLLDETRGLIAMICYNYWCVTESQKEQYIKKLIQNEQQYEKIKQEKYNSNELFTKKTDVEIENIPRNNNETSLVKYRERLFTRFFNFIKSIFKR